MLLTHHALRSGRLSGFLRREFNLSTVLIRRLKTQEALYVDGQPRHTDYWVEAGQRIDIRIEETSAPFPAEPLPFSILYEDDFLLAADKPADMLVHPSPRRMTGTLANRVIAYYQATGQPFAFHPVTRLDRDTMGLVLIAKASPVHERMVRQHTAGQLRKTYRALVFGAPASDSGVIDAPIARCPYPSLLREIAPSGQPACTEYRVLIRYASHSLLELHPLTGRTHQLRVHCAFSGFPILGDPQYFTPASAAFSAAAALTTQQLLAYQLTFPHPMTGESLTITSRLTLPSLS